MLQSRWRYALPLLLALSMGAASARGSAIHDTAGFFSPEAVGRAQATLAELERDSQIAVGIETIDSLQGQSIGDAAIEHARRSGLQGIFILIARKETKIEVEASRAYQQAIPGPRRLAIREAFSAGFKARDFDRGLLDGVGKVASEVAAAKAENGGRLRATAAPGRRGVPVRQGNNGGFSVGTLIFIVLGILAVLFVVRMLGGLMGGGQRKPGMGGYGGGYGGGGGGGGGGGFMSGLFGGIGGAIAGNWLYDQFSGRHQHGGSADNTSTGDAGAPDPGGSDWAGTGGGDWGGGGDAGGGGGDWGGGGGGDW